jgi:hypothetical protein
VKIDSFRINGFCHTDKTCYETELSGVRISVGSRYFLFSISVQTGPPTLLYSGKRRSFRGGKTAGARHCLPTPSSADVKHSYIYTRIHTQTELCLHGILRAKFTFTFTLWRILKLQPKLNLRQKAVCLCLVSHLKAFCEIWFWQRSGRVFRRYRIWNLAGLSAMLSRWFHGFPQPLQANCVVVPVYSPKLKPFQSFPTQIIWSPSHRWPQSNGRNSSFIFGSPSFRYQPGYRLLCLSIRGFSLHPSGK